MFLDNGERVVNPTNMKTPPPPMWGEILEEEGYDPSEEFYDHQKAMREQHIRGKEESANKQQPQL